MRRTRTVRAAVLAVVGLAVAATACGGGPASGEGVATAGGDANGKEVSTKKQTDPQQAGLDFATCMREHGVDMADPTPGQGGFAVRIEGSAGTATAAPTQAAAVNGEVLSTGDNEAFQACKHILDDAIGSADVKIDPEMQDRALKFAQCMREHGVDMPDPQFNGGAVTIQVGGGNGLSPDSPTMQAAHEACNQFFGPPGGEGGGPGRGGFVTSGPVARS